MCSRIGLSLVVAIVSTAPSAAYASITAFWQPVTITPAAITNDPALANMQCWDLMVTSTGDWANGFVEAVLPATFTYYKHSLGGLTRPDPGLFSASPALEFTTFATSPSDNGTNGNTVVLGGYPGPGAPSVGDSTSPSPGRFSMAWTDPFFPDPPGTFVIARFTFPIGVLPRNDASSTVQLNPTESASIPNIPEPTVGTILVITLIVRRSWTGTIRRTP